MREAESVWKTSRVSENVRSVSQANEWTNLYEWTRLLATAVLFPTVQRCTAKCKDAPLHRAKMHCQVQVQCLVRGGIPACQQTHLPTDWQTAHIPATLIHKICPSFTKVAPHSQKLPPIHKKRLKNKFCPSPKKMTVHTGRLQWGPQFRTWNSGPGNQDLDIRTFSGPIQDQDQVPNSGPHCMSWIVLIGTLFKLNCLLPAAKCTYRSLIHKHWRFTPRQSTTFRQEVMCVYLANWVLQLDKWTRYWLHLHRIQYKFI